jgi:TPR repeat protein
LQVNRAQIREAKRLKNASQLIKFGSRLRDGHGVRRDLKLARECFEEAARLGDPYGMSSLGRWLLEFAPGRAARARAVALLRKAEKLGDWTVPFFLGRVAEDDGDWREAERHFERALRKGDLASGTRLASHYLYRLDAASHRKGVEALKRTVAHSDVFPDFVYLEIGKCYLYGQGVPQSNALARKYLMLAAKDKRLIEAEEQLKVLKRPLVAARDQRKR